MGQTRPLFSLFLFFSHGKYSTNTINDKSVNSVLGTRTQGGKIVGADESTELGGTPLRTLFTHFKTNTKTIIIYRVLVCCVV